MRDTMRVPLSAPGEVPALTVGLDVSDDVITVRSVDAAGQLFAEPCLRTTRASVEKRFREVAPCRVVLEVGTHSPWLSRVLAACGHEVLVANTRKLRAISQNPTKADAVDAELEARLGRVDPQLLSPITHRGEQAQADLAVLRARDALVRTRTMLITHVRGVVKSAGGRVRGCSAEAFGTVAEASVPRSHQPALLPLLAQIQSLTTAIRRFDRVAADLAAHAYPETASLSQPRGVGVLTALAYTLVLEDPHRFARSRDVPPFLGLVPRRAQSGASDPQRRITKTGDAMVRRLLVQCAQYLLGPFGEDCDLRRWGMALYARGGKNAKKRAMIAVARKLAVLLHHLWVTGQTYEPLRQASRQGSEPEAPIAPPAAPGCVASAKRPTTGRRSSRPRGR